MYRVTDDHRIMNWEALEGSGHALVETLKKPTRNVIHAYRYPGRYLSQAPPESESRALTMNEITCLLRQLINDYLVTWYQTG